MCNFPRGVGLMMIEQKQVVVYFKLWLCNKVYTGNSFCTFLFYFVTCLTESYYYTISSSYLLSSAFTLTGECQFHFKIEI